MERKVISKCSSCLFEEDRVLRPHVDPCKSCIEKGNNLIVKVVKS